MRVDFLGRRRGNAGHVVRLGQVVCVQTSLELAGRDRKGWKAGRRGNCQDEGQSSSLQAQDPEGGLRCFLQQPRGKRICPDPGVCAEADPSPGGAFSWAFRPGPHWILAITYLFQHNN